MTKTSFLSPLSLCLWALVIFGLHSKASLIVDPVDLVVDYVSLGEWNTTANFEGWSTFQVVTPTVSGGSLNGSVNDGNNDPQFARTNFSSLGIDLDSGNYDFVEVAISRTGTPSRFDLFWGTTGANGFSGTRRVDDQSMLPADSTTHIIQFDMSGEAAWSNTLDDLRFDPFSGFATGGRSFAVDYVRIGRVVPEPSTAAVLGLFGLGLMFRRARRK